MRLSVPGLLFFAMTNIFYTFSASPVHHYLMRTPKTKSDKPPVIILLHGVGGNEKDLFSFAPRLPDSFLVLSLRAPISMGNDGYAWFRVSFSEGRPVADMDQADKSMSLILQFIEKIKGEIPFDGNQIYLCGFSQGASMAYCVGLMHPDKIKGIMVLSGRVLEEIKPLIPISEKIKQLKVFIAHGTKDKLLPIDYARNSYVYLKQLGIDPAYHEYNEGHNNGPAILNDMIGWLK